MWIGQLRELCLTFWKKSRARLLGFANAPEIREIRKQLQNALHDGPRPALDESQLSAEDRALCQLIRQRTEEANRNNVTRTAAYLDIYKRCPELHWALLAHMVSRNGGWNMTDLCGDLIGRTMETGEREGFFHFLERANYLIFGDAYPQLLLYEASRDAGRPLFHLLPCFGVTRFMDLIWARFWKTHDSELLTLALVVNEQNFIEDRVVRHRDYSSVVESFEFTAQTLLNLTQVVFPFYQEGKQKVQLAGTTVKTFRSLAERIDTGRRLYAILFGREDVYQGALRWAEETPHTASRGDYWPHLYAKEPSGAAQAKRYRPRLNGCSLKKGALPFYSPALSAVWPDVERPAPSGGEDWCRDAECVEELYGTKPDKSYNVTKFYCATLMVVERAVAAETWLDHRT
ncbi:MAG: DUF2515 family protein [Tumebacillaceae bacterium]